VAIFHKYFCPYRKNLIFLGISCYKMNDTIKGMQHWVVNQLREILNKKTFKDPWTGESKTDPRRKFVDTPPDNKEAPDHLRWQLHAYEEFNPTSLTPLDLESDVRALDLYTGDVLIWQWHTNDMQTREEKYKAVMDNNPKDLEPIFYTDDPDFIPLDDISVPGHKSTSKELQTNPAKRQIYEET
jgi:hypothetical protein